MALRCLPASGKINATDFTEDAAATVEKILKNHRCLGASLALFDDRGVTGYLAYGIAHPSGWPVDPATVFRAASVSKLVTGLGIMKLREMGRIDLDTEIGEYLPSPLAGRLPKTRAITLRSLMTHTAGIRDSEGYNSGIARGASLSEILSDQRVWEGTPGTWEYSNLGAGLAGAVLEAATGENFESLMQETVFIPLGVAATYYPQKVKGDLADAIRILPRAKTPNFNAAERRARPLFEAVEDPEKHYNLAHGALCVSAMALSKLGMAAMEPGFLTRESLEEMRKIAVPFGARARNLSQGLFTFVLREPKISKHLIYGHQGMAYGAVHGLFFDPEKRRGMALLTTGASEARRGVLADMNHDMLRLFFSQEAQNGSGR